MAFWVVTVKVATLISDLLVEVGPEHPPTSVVFMRISVPDLVSSKKNNDKSLAAVAAPESVIAEPVRIKPIPVNYKSAVATETYSENATT